MEHAAETVQQLKEVVGRFVTEGDWEQFHASKNLAMAIAVEAAGLMGLFQWATVDESKFLASTPETQIRVEDELDLDACSLVRRKFERNADKYLPEAFRGRYRRDGHA